MKTIHFFLASLPYVSSFFPFFLLLLMLLFLSLTIVHSGSERDKDDIQKIRMILLKKQIETFNLTFLSSLITHADVTKDNLLTMPSILPSVSTSR